MEETATKSQRGVDRSHAVCIPAPAQGHINPMFQLAKVLHERGFHVTFVNTHFNHNRMLRSRGAAALDGLPSFRFESIPDGLPSCDADSTQDIPSLCYSTSTTCLPHFRHLLNRLNGPSSPCPPVTCIVSDGVMSFTLDAAEELSIPIALFWTTSACGFLAYMHYPSLTEKGIIPLKDENHLWNGYLEKKIDWIPGIGKIRLRDLPSFLRTTNPEDFMLKFMNREVTRAPRANAIVLNTFNTLESDALDALSSMLPPIYTIGPLHMLSGQITDLTLKRIGSNLWTEQTDCIEWLDRKEATSVVYVNFGSITVMSSEELVEFAWGLARSEKPFLWVIRPDLVSGETAVLPPEFLHETEGRRMVASWCPQEEVLRHPAVGAFLTHSGWNSTIESLASGVPMMCWPFFAEQETNRLYCCERWGVAMEIGVAVDRENVEKRVRELMEGVKGKDLRRRAAKWKEQAAEAVAGRGSSAVNLDRLLTEVLKSVEDSWSKKEHHPKS